MTGLGASGPEAVGVGVSGGADGTAGIWAVVSGAGTSATGAGGAGGVGCSEATGTCWVWSEEVDCSRATGGSSVVGCDGSASGLTGCRCGLVSCSLMTFTFPAPSSTLLRRH
ncbi:hypothetical protein GCM10027575_32910 [Phytohabitans suffuscus]